MHNIRKSLILYSISRWNYGISKIRKNFFSILYRNNIIKDKIFSLCLSQDGGYFSLGEIDNKFHLNNEIKYINISKPSYYYINSYIFLIGLYKIIILMIQMEENLECIQVSLMLMVVKMI